MNKLTGKDFYETLKRLDIDTGSFKSESLDWLFDNKEINAILYWFCTYVTEHNVESSSIESSEYEDLQLSFMNDSILKKEVFITNSLETESLRTNSLKREIENEKIEKNHIESFISKYLNLEGKLMSKLRKLEEKEIDARVKNEALKEECEMKSKRLDLLHCNLHKNSQDMSDLLSNLEKNTFFCQMPLNSYTENWLSLNSDLNLWIRKNMELNNMNNTVVNIHFIQSETQRMKNVLEESIINSVKSECAEQEMLVRVNHLRNISYSHISVDSPRIQEIQLTSRINLLNGEINRIYVSDLQTCAKKCTLNLINTFFIKNAEIKLIKSRRLLNMLKSINNELSYALAQFVFIFHLLKSDRIKIQDIHNFCKNVYIYFSKYLKKHTLKSEIMQEIEFKVHEQKTNNSSVFKEKEELLMRTIQNIEENKIVIDDLENRYFISKNQKYWNYFRQMEGNMNKIQDIIFCGPTTKSVIIPYENVYLLNFVELQVEKVHQELNGALERYKKNLKILEKNQWLKYRRLLWAFFMSKPVELPKLTEKIKSYVYEQAKNKKT